MAKSLSIDSRILDKRLQGALLRIWGDHPFFGTLALFAEFRMSDMVETATTDGKVILFNPAFTTKQDPSQLCGLIVHELLHAALQHLPRRREREPMMWNIAADIVVNGMIRQDTSYNLPVGCVEDANLSQLSVEEIYEQFSTGKLPLPNLSLIDLMPGDGNTAIEVEQDASMQRHWRSALQQSCAVARRIGKGFGKNGLDRIRDIIEVTSPTLNWREILWQYVVATPCDFGGFDRRFVWQKLYLEEVVGESVQIAIVIDTSGSVSGNELGEFMGEIKGILDAYPQIHGQLFYADTHIYGPYDFGLGEEIPKPKGGGGTSFIPFFKWVSQQLTSGFNPLCIYLTDGDGEFPKEAPEVPVLWVVCGGGLESNHFPFGKVVRMGV